MKYDGSCIYTILYISGMWNPRSPCNYFGVITISSIPRTNKWFGDRDERSGGLEGLVLRQMYIPILYVCGGIDDEERQGGGAESRKDVADEWRRERETLQNVDRRDAELLQQKYLFSIELVSFQIECPGTFNDYVIIDAVFEHAHHMF